MSQDLFELRFGTRPNVLVGVSTLLLQARPLYMGGQILLLHQGSQGPTGFRVSGPSFPEQRASELQKTWAQEAHGRGPRALE